MVDRNYNAIPWYHGQPDNPNVNTSCSLAGSVWFKVEDSQPPETIKSYEVKCANGFQCVAWMNDAGLWNMDLPFDMDHILKDVVWWKELTPPPE